VSVVVTGAAGFVGSHLCERFLAAGETVYGVDNYITGNRRNVASFENDARFTLIEADVSTERDAIARAVRDVRIVLHFASPASPVDYARRSLETLDVNSLGTRTCLDLARAHGASFLYASTSECYGDPLMHPQTEEYWGNVNPVGPRACYDEAKRFGEALTTTYRRVHGLDVRIVRIFNTYGPRMRLDDGRVVPNFIKQALSGEPITMYGDGSQTRSFCYVQDLCEGIFRLARSDRAAGEIVNLGNPDERSIREFAEVVCRLAGAPLEIVSKPLPPDDPTRRCPDIAKARRLLGWEPKIGLEEGLRRTIEYFAPFAGAPRS